MSYIRASEDELEQSIRDYAKGNTFSLFKTVLGGVWDDRKLLSDPNFIINMINNLRNPDDLNSFVDLVIEKYVDFTIEYSEGEPNLLENYNNFWKNSLPSSAPLLFYLIPHLTDNQLFKVLDSSCFDSYKINTHKDSTLLFEALTLILVEHNYVHSLEKFLGDYYTKRHLKVYESKSYIGYDNEITLDRIFYNKSLIDLNYLDLYASLTNCGINSICETWFTEQMGQEKKNNGIINQFLNTKFNELEIETKERIIAETLSNIDNTDFLMTALKNYGCEKLYDYKPTKVPVWLMAGNHKNPKIYRKLMRTGTDLFDYYGPSNRLFVGAMLEGLPYNQKISVHLDEQKVGYDTYIKRLFESRVDKDGKQFTNFSAIISTGDNTLCKSLTFPLSDLEHYSKKFKPERYEKLKPIQKIELINEVMDKTFLAPVYIASDMGYSYSLKDKQINLNAYLNSSYDNEKTLPLIDEHLSLLEQVPVEKYDYRPIYFKLLTQIFSFYSTRSIQPENPRYTTLVKIIDYLASDKNLDWKQVDQYLNSEYVLKNKDNFAEGTQNLYNYISKICLSYSLSPSVKSDHKKIKI